MLSSASRVAALVLAAFLGACSSSPKPDDTNSGQGGTDGTNIGGRGGSANSGGSNGGLIGDGGGNGNGCVATTCAVQGKNCGIVADGCGSTLDCGSCADGQLCGVVTGNVCTAVQDLCHPVAPEVACAGKACGVEGDGCGNIIDCGTCPDGQQCGLGQAFQCGVIPVSSDTECPARITSCASVGARCGLIGNGCGGTIDCTAELGACGAGQVCGIDSPQQCGALPTCQPRLAADVCTNAVCGPVSNGCGIEVSGGVVDCACSSGTCGGGGVRNQCGSGAAVCTPILQATACGAKQCGVASNGCGSSYTCGLGCDVGEECVAGTCEPTVCTPVPQGVACDNKSCGQVGNGCGGTYTCGTCSGGEVCGANVAFQCSNPPPGPGCIPRTPAQACAGKECGTAYDGCGTGPASTFNCASVNGTHNGSCPSGEFCGLVTPFQCDAPVIPPCTPTATSCAQAGWACGQFINNCGTIYDCALENRTCNSLQACVGGVTGPTTCESPGGGTDCDLCDDVPSCSGQAQLTRLTGRVITPGRIDANTANQIGVPNAFVYILRNNDPNDLPPITAGIPSGGLSCDRCADQDLGPVLASAVSDSSGNFTIEGNVPVNTPFLLVTKIGKFRRAVSMTVPSNKACQTTVLPTTMPNNPTRLPRTLVGDGLAVNIPQISISTGRIDAMECVFEKMGIQANQFSAPGGGGRITLYRADGAWANQTSKDTYYNCWACGTGNNATDNTCRTNNCGGQANSFRTSFLAPMAPLNDSALFASVASMSANDMVVFDCEGGGWDSGFTQRAANGDNIREYVNRGGRMFLSHLSFSWLRGNGANAYAPGAAAIQTGLDAAGTWDTNSTSATNVQTSGTGVVSITPALPAHPRRSPRIQTFADWMVNEGVTTAPSYTFGISDPRSMNLTLGASTEEFVYRSDGNARVQQLSFNTPYGAPTDAACGRVAYSGFHVATTNGGNQPFQDQVFPAYCSQVGHPLSNNGNFTPQEKILLFMLFDLGTCVGVEPEPPTCEPLACPANGTCGRLPDGCGGHIDCGCLAGSACVANQCQGCTPTTCAAEGVICSTINDGCGTPLVCPCPVCTPIPQATACSGHCGAVSDGCSNVYQCPSCPQGCTPLTACPPGINCGVISNGCNGTLNCGTCPSGQACGAGGANVCGNQCQPLGCYDVSAGCGAIGNGCGGSVQCGTCPPGQVCTIVNGVPNQCAGCVRSTKQAACDGLNCGVVGDGCGGIHDCGDCPSGETCGAQSPNQCGTGPQCDAQTCQAVGAQCGIIGDGCGGQVNCGNCPAGKLCGVTTPYQCGDAPVCNPATCTSLGTNCGQVGDGCGGLLDCGVCPSGFTCGLGAANVCAQIR